MGGHDYVEVKDDEIEMKLETAATHADWFDGPVFFLQLQYLVNAQTDLFELYLTKGSFFGKDVPKEYIDQHENIMDGLYNDPDAEDARAIVEGIERVVIKEGKIVI